ncbi:MAG: methyl-accepting chemotaxis protein [Deltaproteobacteria bacterium]|nr:methyl-accepting chemotaxis protein [Deltaproteobacteria bacterium]
MLRNVLQNIAVREKLWFLSGLLVFAVIIVWGSSYQSFRALKSYFDAIPVHLVAVQQSARANMVTEGILGLPYQALITADTKNTDEEQAVRARMQQFAEQLRAHLAEIEALPLQASVREVLAVARPAADQYLVKADQLVRLALNGQRQQVLADMPQFLAMFAKLGTSLSRLEALIGEEAARRTTQETATIASARQTSFIISLCTMLLAFALSLGTAHVITAPLVEMATVASQLAKGNINQQILHHSRDEIGTLATAFRDLIAYIRNLAEAATRISQGDLRVQVIPQSAHDVLSLRFVAMLADLHDMNSRMQHGARTLASSIDQILVILQQVTASTAETATSVSETATTVEEVKQTAYVATQNAQQVVENNQRTVQVSQAGEQAVEAALMGMQHVRAQMESIAHSVMKLGEQSQTIGEIITTVNDLAERSNLLAINAGIEAAKAGEAGKGFSVVAQEVKNLADQSKRATAQVHTMLGDIQKAAQVAILVTEQGTQSAELGATQAIQAGEAIRALSKNILDAAQSVTKISTSSQQQLIGMDQVASAMNSIKLASTQNVEGMKQIETAIRDIHLVGQTLKELVEQYKLTTPANGAVSSQSRPGLSG